jgi:hypothetical protein
MVISFTILDEELPEFKAILERGLPFHEAKHSILEAYLRRWIKGDDERLRS